MQQLQYKSLLSKNDERNELRTHSETVLQKKRKTINATLTRLNYFWKYTKPANKIHKEKKNPQGTQETGENSLGNTEKAAGSGA